MSSEILKVLFDNIMSDCDKANKLYDPLCGYGEFDDKLSSVYTEQGLTPEQQRPIDEIIMDIAYLSEQHGFEQGFKLAYKLTAAMLCDNNE